MAVTGSTLWTYYGNNGIAYRHHSTTGADIAPAIPAALDGENLWPVLCGKSATSPRKPMVWVFPEYGGQVAVRIGDYKIVRCNLNKPKQIGLWEVYDLAHDRNETTNIARQHPELVQAALDILKKEATENPVFPVQIQ